MGVYQISPDGLRSNHTFGEVTLCCTPDGRLDLLCHELHGEFPRLVMQHKRAHWYWRLLHWIVLIVSFGGNRKFNDRYTTTTGMLIGWSDKCWEKIGAMAERPVPSWEDRIWTTLQHEREHLRQFDDYGLFAMLILYIFVFLPIGLAYFRARFERAGYLRTLRCWYVLNQLWAESEEARKWWIGQFTGGAYFWMWPFKTQVGKWYDDELKRLQGMDQVTFS